MGSSNDIIRHLNHNSSEKNVEDHIDQDSFLLLFFKRSVGATSKGVNPELCPYYRSIFSRLAS
jgi:hypothetical protein